MLCADTLLVQMLRCHQCILAARSEYFRALLERSLARGSPGSAGPGAACAGSGQGPPLPEAVIGGISAGAFEAVLRFVYTDSISVSAVPDLTPGAAACDRNTAAQPAAEGFGVRGPNADTCSWLDAESAEELLFAADLFLLFSLKVCRPFRVPRTTMGGLTVHGTADAATMRPQAMHSCQEPSRVFTEAVGHLHNPRHADTCCFKDVGDC